MSRFIFALLTLASPAWANDFKEQLLHSCVRALAAPGDVAPVEFGRLRIRQGKAADRAALEKIWNDHEGLRLYFGIKAISAEKKQRIADLYLTGNAVRMAPSAPIAIYDYIVEEIASGEVIGIGHVSFGKYFGQSGWDLGYAIIPEKRRQGFARELVTGLMEQLREYSPNVDLYAQTLRSNVKSQVLLKELGFEFKQELKVAAYAEPLLFWRYLGDHSRAVQRNSVSKVLGSSGEISKSK